jgi:hypothetical protein
MKSSISLALVAVAGALLTGCGSVKLADPARGNELKQFAPNKAVGQVYVCRNSTFFGAGVKPAIEIDGKPIGNVGRSNFAYAELAPGEHIVVAKTLEHDSKMPFTIAAGEQKFFQTWISMGVIVSGWGLVDAFSTEDGKKCVTDGQLVEPEAAVKTAAK